MRFVAYIVLVFVCSLLVLSTGIAVAQSNWSDDASIPPSNLRVDSWTAEQGLHQTEFAAIRQTGSDYLWLGGRHGLIRFDGSRFHTFDESSSFASGQITALHEDGAGNLWIGTDDGGLALYSAGTFSMYTSADGLSSNHVTAIAEDRHGNFWIGTADAGITLLRNGDVVQLGAADGLPGSRITALHADQDGSIWIGATGGALARYRDGSVDVFGSDAGVSGQEIAAFLQDASGKMWIGTRGGGLLRFHQGRFDRFTTKDGLPSDHILSLAADASGMIWIGTDRGGLARFDGSGFLTLSIADGLSHDVVSSLYADDEGSLWVGTGGGGLNRIRKNRFTRYTTAEGLAHDSVYSIFEDERGTLWIGTDAGVTRVSNGQTSTLSPKDGLSSSYVLSIAGSRDGSVWIGTYGDGLNRYQNGRITTFSSSNGLPGDEIYPLYEDEAGDLWIGTRTGLGRYSDSRFTSVTTKDGLSGNDVTSITADGSGGLWVGTYDAGLNLLRDGKVVGSFSIKDGLPSDHILTLVSDDDGTVWAGTRGGGLARYRDGQFVAITPRDGLFSENIFQILEDERGFLWMSSDRGLFRVSKRELNAFADGVQTEITSIVYDGGDGLAAGGFKGGFQPAGIRAADGRLWLPTNKGVVAVEPMLSSGNAAAPMVVLEGITADEKAVSLNDPIKIPAGSSRFQFDYVGVTFIAPERLQYRYKLKGVDEDWVYPGGRRQAYYANLKPGHYTFSVEARDLGGAWSAQPTATSFTLTPYFYETPLFQLLCLIAAAILILGAYRWRVQHLKAREEELLELIDLHTKHLREEKEKTERALMEADRARQEAERQKEIAQRARAVIEEQAEQLREVDRIKTRFFNNVSHEFRTPLTLTIGPLENMLAGVYGPLHDQAQKQLDLALRNARRLLRLINQLLDLSKLESGKMELTVMRGNVVPLVEGVMMSFTAFAERKNLGLSFATERNDVSLYFDPACLEKVLFNLLSNAVKFTEDGGNVWVSIDDGTTVVAGRDHDAVLIHVKDTGIGIPAEQLPYIFDRFHQVDGAVANANEGTGIGLSLVKELVEMHHGTITVHSEPGVGSEFIVALPKGLAHFSEDVLVGDRTGDGMPDVSRGPMMEMAVLSDDEELWSEPFGDLAAIESPPSFSGTPAATSVNRSLTGDRNGIRTASIHKKEFQSAGSGAPRILIVDDNPDVVEYVANALCDEYTVIPAENGDQALELACRHEPHLVISDVMMPGMDGYTLCRHLKSHESLRHIPVILLTARAAQEDKIEGLEAGSDDYMSKPFSTRELKARVRNLLTVRDQQQQLSHLNSELAEKNDALREASEMKTQLLNIAAHDMKNPLNAIREFAQILKSEIGEQSDHYDPLDLIHKSSDQMLNLVSTLLDSSALETGQITLNKKPIDINSLAAAVVRRNQKLAEKKDQALNLSISADRCLVYGDKSRILEAMDNLVNNAVKYSPYHRPIRIAVERTASSVQFSVKDEGPGLSQDDKSKLFGKFQRLSAQPTGGETSTGLGLAIIKQIVELHDGEIFVQSERGKGSTFTIDLPIISDGGL